MTHVFLDGTENGSNWREELQKDFEQHEITSFDPTIKERSRRTIAEELEQKSDSNFHLYVITPKMDDFENISEMVEDSNKFPGKTIFCFQEKDENAAFNEHQIKSLKRIGEMVERNGGKWCKDLGEITTFIKENL